MAPYLKQIESSNSSLISTLSEKNDKHLATIDERLKDAEENLGDSEISELLRERATYLCRIGDKVRKSPKSQIDDVRRMQSLRWRKQWRRRQV